MSQILDIFRHLPEHLELWATQYGVGLYFILGLIIFAETGLVVTPLLPGDSLLFATGALLARDIPGLSLPVMCLCLIGAAFLGDLVNYHVGKWAAPHIFAGERFRWLNRKHLDKTKEFYARHGGRTLVLARFIPIVRTYAPFVGGVSGLPLGRFIAFSLLGGTLWISGFVSLGFFFGNIPAIKRNFELAVLGVIAISLLPLLYEYFRSRSKNQIKT